MVRGHWDVMSKRTEIQVAAGRGARRRAGADLVNMHGVLPRRESRGRYHDGDVLDTLSRRRLNQRYRAHRRSESAAINGCCRPWKLLRSRRRLLPAKKPDRNE